MAAAFHQAGHVALCVYYGIGVRELRPPGTAPVDLELESPGPNAQSGAEAWFKMYLAGGIAEGRYLVSEGKSSERADGGTDEDKLRIRKLCLRHYPAATTSTVVMNRLLENSSRGVRIHFADPRMWSAVCDLADALTNLNRNVRGEEKDALLDIVRERLRS